MNPQPALVLASASPRRRELLSQLGLSLTIRPVELDETPAAGEKAADYVRRVAGEKCDAAFAALPAGDQALAVLGADTIVIADGQILGKPRDAADARAMLQRLAGRRHEVTTAYRIRRAPDRMVERAVTTLVSFRLLQPPEIDAYLACGEWKGKAGGYAVQGIAAAFVTELRGSHTNVIGLPLAEVIGDLLALGALAGYPPPRLRDAALTRAEEISAGLQSVRQRVADAERAAGRAAGSVRLVAISKKMTAADVQIALSAGQLDFGENYGQELRDKRAAVPGLRWHFVGPLQANKVKYVAGQVALIHSVDSIPLLDAIDARGVPQACLVQVNVAGESQKRGVAVADLPPLLDHFAKLANVRCEGLMVIPPLGDEPEASRATFAALRTLRDQNAAATRPNVDLRELSMGMSHDLEVAIAEGATLVRIGTAIFGERPQRGG